MGLVGEEGPLPLCPDGSDPAGLLTNLRSVLGLDGLGGGTRYAVSEVGEAVL